MFMTSTEFLIWNTEMLHSALKLRAEWLEEMAALVENLDSAGRAIPTPIMLRGQANMCRMAIQNSKNAIGN